MLISIVAALDEKGLIGSGGRLPWRLRGDLRRFRRLTMGKPVLMGRRTFESIGRPLDGRTNIVLSRQPGYEAPGCRTAASFDAALAAVRGAEEVMVIGGAGVYAQALPPCAPPASHPRAGPLRGRRVLSLLGRVGVEGRAPRARRGPGWSRVPLRYLPPLRSPGTLKRRPSSRRNALNAPPHTQPVSR